MKHNWEYKRLGEVCTFVGGGTPSKSNTAYYDGNIPWATVRDMTEFNLSTTEFHISNNAVKQSATNIIPTGTIVISTHVGLGKICCLMQDTAINQDLKGVLFKDNANIAKFYFAYWYQSISNFIIDQGKGATVKGVTLNFMNSLSIPVPPMAVQEQIVAELDKINEVIADNREMLKQLSALQKSIFYDMFGDPVNNPMHWGTSKLKDVAPAIPSKLKPLELGGKIWLLNLDQIESNSGNIIQIQFFDKSEVGLSTVSFDTDNVLYSKLRPYLNKVVIPLSNGICTSELIPLRPQKEILNKIYLGFALRLPEFVDYINGKTGGAKMPRVKMPYFWAFELPVPPLPLQEEFAKKIEAIEAQKATIESNIKELQTLLDSRMDYWFN
jgi:type I restriction enzyme S subunit